MAKFKVVMLIILTVVLVDFALENAQPAPLVKLFKFPVGELPMYLLVYISLALGVLIGWFAHALRTRRKKRTAQELQAALAQQRKESQEGQGSHQAY